MDAQTGQAEQGQSQTPDYEIVSAAATLRCPDVEYFWQQSSFRSMRPVTKIFDHRRFQSAKSVARYSVSEKLDAVINTGFSDWTLRQAFQQGSLAADRWHFNGFAKHD